MFCNCLLQFQFQNGTIKSSRTATPYGNNSRFQFQNGTIKSLRLFFSSSVGKEFQFQNGTIKRTVILI